ncbi:hypothetical protein ACH3XW_50090 [Acanthocheilonema viteae]|uniref:Uncharacterized protein n=1 Tax=Acanthocheilonema viteae TaxID=6277 RepID=A0A498SLV1_ACAVI|nr:unnamed protein product [Acanthocheilonema viteae]
MECNVDGKFNDGDNLGHSNNKATIDPKNVSLEKNNSRKRRRKRPRTKALRRTIREKIEIALCTSDSPIQNVLETDKDCMYGAPLSTVVKLLKLDTDEYRKLSYEALVSIGRLSRFFAIIGHSIDSLQLVLKTDGLKHNSAVVYVGKTYSNKDSATNDTSVSAEVSTSAACTGRFFQSAFIKFVHDESSADFIKFHQLLRKKAANRRRKKLKLERKKAVKRSANSVSKIRSKKRLKKNKRKPKKNAEDRKIKNEEAMETSAEKPEVDVDNFSDVIRSEGNYNGKRKRKRRSSRGMNKVLLKKAKMIINEEKKVETEAKNESKNAEENGFKNADPKKAYVKIDVAEGKQESKDDEKVEIDGGFTAAVTGELLKKTFRDVGTDVPEEFLLTETGDAVKKRKRVHRQRRRDGKPKNCNQRPKKYFRNIQVYSLDTFQKLRARYLELKKQQMVELKANLKKKGVPNTLSDLTKKERKKKRGRSRLMMRAAKLREYDNLIQCIPEEDRPADSQECDKNFSSITGDFACV